MTSDNVILFSLFVAVFALMIWGRFRYDLIAFGALIIAAILGVIPAGEVFAGFGHPATIIVAIVLIISRGLVNSGAVGWIARLVVDTSRGLSRHIALMAAIGAAMSAFMNNVAALALLMPVEISASAKAGRSPALSLMPLAFATILGGMVTLIGTPPNIIIAAYRGEALGESYGMFSFAPVGLVCAVVGIAYVALIGWRLIPVGNSEKAPTADLRDIHGYVAELAVPEKSPAIGRLVGDLDDPATEAGVAVLGLIRNGRRLPGGARREEIREDDILVVDGPVEAIDALVGSLKLDFPRRDSIREAGSDLALLEVVVPRDSRLDGRSAGAVGLNRHTGVALLGVSRQGRRFRDRVRQLPVRAGDVLLLIGPPERLGEAANWLRALPLADRGIGVTQHGRAALAGGLFAAAVALASFGLLYLPVALAAVVALYVLFDIVPLRQVYDEIEWPVVILLGSMIPLGMALERSGGTELIAGGIVDLASGLPPWVVLTVLMVVVMTLSDVLNNTATAVIGAPIALNIAERLDASPDPFLMAVAVASSCAFLTPIGHKNNTLILGPGGYAFGDYWRMGLPLELIIVAVGVPAILVVWPL
ncbi:MAG: SLC13 family permease [Bauldia sp.]|uniref:SLC13 family permease n=1 Tax=Bauldia sp. TaxID=2575872 RepID=UPI001DB4EEF6|nr:SLC13 family permease [Bauldia sp.]MCB1497486.1 SLC13 family permease [Bauldia sp.]